MPGPFHGIIDMTALRTLLFSLALAPAAASACSEILQNAYRPLTGKEKVELCSLFEGKVLLVVNTASKCGFTPQYEALEAMHAKYAGQGFAVVGFPSNDFMNQEPGSEQQIQLVLAPDDVRGHPLPHFPNGGRAGHYLITEPASTGSWTPVT